MSSTYKNEYEIVRLLKMHDTEQAYVVVHFTISNYGVDRDIIFSFSDVNSGKFAKQVPNCLAMGHIKQLQRDINDAIEHYMPELLLPQGFSCVNGKWMYVLGDQILNRTDLPVFVYNPQQLHPYDGGAHQNPMVEAYHWCNVYCQQGDAQTALLLCALSPLLRPVVDSLELPCKTVNGYVVGTTGVGKSAYAQLVASLCDKCHGADLANDKLAILSALSEARDEPFLADDLCKSSSQREVERREEKLLGILQMSSSGADINVKGIQLDVRRVAILTTAEFLPANPSTINRCVVINMTDEMNSPALTYLQQNRGLYSYFVAQFVEWICQNADLIQDVVSRCLERGSFEMSNAHEHACHYSGFARVAASHKMLSITAYVLTIYLKSKWNELVKDSLLEFQARLYHGIDRTIGDTLDSIKRPDHTSKIVDAMLEIFYCDPDHVIAKDVKEYFDHEGKYIFFHNDIPYFKGEVLANYLQVRLGEEVSLQKLSNELMLANLITPRGAERTARLPKKCQNEATGRFYRMNLAGIVDLVRSTYGLSLFWGLLWEILNCKSIYFKG